jgi:hypothetical protein
LLGVGSLFNPCRNIHHAVCSRKKVHVILQPTVSRPVCPGVRQRSRPVTNFLFSLKLSLDSCLFVLWRPLWREDGSVIYFCCSTSPAQSLSGMSPAGLKAIFYSPNFLDFRNLERQVPVFIFPGTGWPSNTPQHWVPFPSPLTTRRATVDAFQLASTPACSRHFSSIYLFIYL